MQIRLGASGGVPGGAQAGVQHTNLDGSGLDATARAVEGLGKTTFNIAQQEQQRQAAESRALANAKAANGLSDNQLRLRELTDDIGGRVQRGELPYDKAEETFQAESSKLVAADIAELDPAMRETFVGGIRSNTLAGGLAVGSIVKQARRDDGKAQVSKMFDLKAKEAGIPGADVDKINSEAEVWRENARHFGIDGSVFDKQLQDFKDANWMNHVSQRAIDTRNDIAETGKLIHDLSADDGYYLDKLDPARRTAALSVATNNLARLQSNIQVDADKREAKATTALTFYQDNIVTGIQMDPAKVLELQAATAGTSRQAEFVEAMHQGVEIQQVKGMPFLAQQQYIDQVETQLRTTPSDNPKRDEARVATLRKALEGSQKLAAESPILLAQYTTGQTAEPIDFGKILGSDSGDYGQGQLVDRYDLLHAMRRRFGPQVAMNPWRPEEAAGLNLILNKAENGQAKLMLLGMVAKAAPDVEAYKQTIAPLTQDDRVAYLAGIAQFQKQRSEKGVDVASTMLLGQRVLKDKTLQLPSEDAFQKAFDASVGDALPLDSEGRSDAYQRFRNLYAGLADKVGNRAAKDGTIDATLTATAISLSTGGITKYNDRNTVMPFGMKESDFKSSVRLQIGMVSRATGAAESMLEDMPLIPIQGFEGQYFLNQGGRTWADPKTGKPVIVRVK